MKKDNSFIISSLFLTLLTGLSVILSLRLTGWHFAYALDDPYIHLSMAKYLTQGLLTVDGTTPASASSSPLWIMIISLSGTLLPKNLHLYLPFALNFIFQILTLRAVSSYIGYKRFKSVFLILFIIITPFISLSFGGMEHSLQIYLCAVMLISLKKYLDTGCRIYLYQLYAAAPFLVFTRYESISVVLGIALVLSLYKKNYKASIIITAVSVIFVILYGFISVGKGLGFLPSSIISKASVESSGLGDMVIKKLEHFLSNFKRHHLMMLFFVNLWLLFRTERKKTAMIVLFFAAFIIHLTGGGVGWLYRYEAYIVVLGILNIFTYDFSKESRLTVVLVILILFYAFAQRSYQGIRKPVIGTKNIYEQQIQMAGFLTAYPEYSSIAACDIGAVTYFPSVRLLDLSGLGNYEIIKLRSEGLFNSEHVNPLLREYQTQIIIIYDKYFEGLEYEGFVKAAQWRIKNNQVCGDDRVSFYVRAEDYNAFKRKIADFSLNSLPDTVDYEIY